MMLMTKQPNVAKSRDDVVTGCQRSCRWGMMSMTKQPNVAKSRDDG